MNESTDAETADAATGPRGKGSAGAGSGAEYVPSPSERVRDQVAGTRPPAASREARSAGCP